MGNEGDFYLTPLAIVAWLSVLMPWHRSTVLRGMIRLADIGVGWRGAIKAQIEHAQSPPIAERRCVLYERNYSIAGGHNKMMKSQLAEVTIISALCGTRSISLRALLKRRRRGMRSITLACRHR
jgi:hypothetical protein